MLKGLVYEVRGARYLEVQEQIPAGKSEWQPVKAGSWMPFDGGPHNGGTWLHDPETWEASHGDDREMCRRF